MDLTLFPHLQADNLCLYYSTEQLDELSIFDENHDAVEEQQPSTTTFFLFLQLLAQ